MPSSRAIVSAISATQSTPVSVPLVPAYAAELNQVWTNLIDNAVQAMQGSGTLTLRTSMDDRWEKNWTTGDASTASWRGAVQRARVVAPVIGSEPIGTTKIRHASRWRAETSKPARRRPTRSAAGVQSAPGAT